MKGDVGTYGGPGLMGAVGEKGPDGDMGMPGLIGALGLPVCSLPSLLIAFIYCKL